MEDAKKSAGDQPNPAPESAPVPEPTPAPAPEPEKVEDKPHAPHTLVAAKAPGDKAKPAKKAVDVKPKAKPAATGANAGGALFVQISGSGPDGSESFTSPIKFRPISIARKLMNIEKKPGNWP